MKIRKLNNWKEFEDELDKIHLDLHCYKKSEYDHVSTPLFRGQSIATWSLKSTLDRYIEQPVEFDAYTQYLLRVKPAIESFTERNFTFKWNNKSTQQIMAMHLDGGFLEGQYEFMAHLRHHGFPSPLLDWSKSPYVALFFALREADESQPVAVYVYVEFLGEGKSGIVGAPEIASLGHYIYSHKRHFIQQSEYTVCVEKKDKTWFYCSHEAAFEREDDNQDMLLKLELPGSEKINILKKLDQMNVNSFSLFGNEEGLMQMLAFREKDGLVR